MHYQVSSILQTFLFNGTAPRRSWANLLNLLRDTVHRGAEGPGPNIRVRGAGTWDSSCVWRARAFFHGSEGPAKRKIGVAERWWV